MEVSEIKADLADKNSNISEESDLTPEWRTDRYEEERDKCMATILFGMIIVFLITMLMIAVILL